MEVNKTSIVVVVVVVARVVVIAEAVVDIILVLMMVGRGGDYLDTSGGSSSSSRDYFREISCSESVLGTTNCPLVLACNGLGDSGHFLRSLYTFRIQSVFLLLIKYTHDYPQVCMCNCSRRSRRGLVQEDKRMAFVYTHGLFIT